MPTPRGLGPRRRGFLSLLTPSGQARALWALRLTEGLTLAGTCLSSVSLYINVLNLCGSGATVGQGRPQIRAAPTPTGTSTRCHAPGSYLTPSVPDSAFMKPDRHTVLGWM